MIVRRCTVAMVLLLSVYSSARTEPPPVYVPPSPPTEKAIGAAVATIGKDAKLVSPLEISAVRPNDRGLGAFFVCVREMNPPPDKPRRYYSTFFDNDDYKGSRLSVITEQCELQEYSPAPVAPSPTEPVKPEKRKSHRSSE